MATIGNSYKMQGRVRNVRYPVSEAGQGGKAVPQSSLSRDHSSASMDHLAFTDYNIISDEVSSHKCKSNVNFFCYICAELVLKMHRKILNKELQKIYKEFFEIEVLNVKWTP